MVYNGAGGGGVADSNGCGYIGAGGGDGGDLCAGGRSGGDDSGAVDGGGNNERYCGRVGETVIVVMTVYVLTVLEFVVELVYALVALVMIRHRCKGQISPQNTKPGQDQDNE